MKVIPCDVLVIGAGGAGLRAAIAARRALKGGKVVLVSKGLAGRSGVTATACSDRMAFHATLPHTEPGGPDKWKSHAEDIYRIGGYVSDGDLAEILAKEARTAFEYLDHLGVPFVKRPDGHTDQFVTDGSDYARACYTGPRTANHIEEALMTQISSLEIKIVDHCMAVDLVLHRGRVIGALGLDERERDPEKGLIVLSGKTTVLATGGAGEVYGVHLFPLGMTGDGYAMAYRAGAELVNMEFIQIGLSSVKTKLACSGSIMRAIPRFVNERGEEFLPRYFPSGTSVAKICNLVFEKGASWPVSREKETHRIDVAAFQEIVRGGRVYLDFRANPQGFRFDELETRWQARYQREIQKEISAEARRTSPLQRLREINPDSVDWLKEHGIDLRAGDPIEIAPSAQHFQGGVKIGPRGNTSLEGLYAAGECAGGQHGANRPGGNALLDGQVFGKVAGHEAAVEAMSMRRRREVSPNQIRGFLSRLKKRNQGRNAVDARRDIQSVTSTFAGIIRTEEGLKTGLKTLARVRREGIAVDERGWIYALETANVLDVAEMVLRACRIRKESRGAHLFFAHLEDSEPQPTRDPEGRKYVVIQKQGDKMVLRKRTPVKLWKSKVSPLPRRERRTGREAHAP